MNFYTIKVYGGVQKVKKLPQIDLGHGNQPQGTPANYTEDDSAQVCAKR